MEFSENSKHSLGWISSDSIHWFSPEDPVWKAREWFRPFFFQKKVVYGLIPPGTHYFCGEKLAFLGNLYGPNLLECPLREVPELFSSLEENWKLLEKKSQTLLYARTEIQFPNQVYDVNIFQQYPPMGTGPAWRLDRFTCAEKHKFLFYSISQGNKVCPKCLTLSLS